MYVCEDVWDKRSGGRGGSQEDDRVDGETFITLSRYLVIIKCPSRSTLSLFCRSYLVTFV